MRTRRDPSSATVTRDTRSAREPQAAQTSMSVRSEHITVTDKLPAPTQLVASNATVLQDGLVMASNVQTWTSAPTGHTCATTMLNVSTPWAHIAVHARRDSLEMDSTAQTVMSVQRTATCVRAATV